MRDCLCYNHFMDLAALKMQMASLLADFPEISLVYLFGSRVTGEIGPLSDYDFAILCDPSLDVLDLQARLQHALTLLLGSNRIDVVILHRAPIELAYHVIAEGALLFQRQSTERIEYEAGVLTRYGDYLPVLRFFRQHLLKGDQDGGRVQRYRQAFERTQRTLGKIKATAKEKPG